MSGSFSKASILDFGGAMRFAIQQWALANGVSPESHDFLAIQVGWCTAHAARICVGVARESGVSMGADEGAFLALAAHSHRGAR